MEFDVAHIHIVLNHVPALGTMGGVLLLMAAIHRKDDTLKNYTFQFLVLMALAGLATYLTGNPARRFLIGRPAASLGMVELHQNAAMLTLAMMTISGTFAWFGLWQTRRFSRAGTFTTLGTLLTTGLAAGMILYTAGLGGKISHPEIREGVDVGIKESMGWRAGVEEKLATAWAWPALETLHFVGMTLLFGVLLLLMLRMLGFMKSIPFSGIHRLLPLAVLGFAINVVTGMLFYMSGPGGYFTKTGFLLKMVFVFLAAAPILYFTVFDDPWRTGSNMSASATSKIAAVSAFTFLLAVMIFGRLLPFFH